MPHKKAKKSIRVRTSQTIGHDLAPVKHTVTDEGVPKALARVLNAVKIREEYNNKRKLDDDPTEGKDVRKRRKKNNVDMTIRPGESLQHFNKRVENDMRPLVKSAVQSSNATIRRAQKTQKSKATSSKPESKSSDNDDDDDDDLPPPTRRDEPKTFQPKTTSQPKRLNDIAQAPPELPRLKRAGSTTTSAKADNVLSMAQRAMMDVEREKAIKRYRELKAAKNQASSATHTG